MSHATNRRAEVLQCFQVNDSFLYTMQTAEKQRLYKCFHAKERDFLYLMRTTKEQTFYNVFSPLIPFYTPYKQHKSRGFTIFSGQSFLSISHANNRREEILLCFQTNDPFLYPMQTTEEQKFYKCFQVNDPFLYPMRTVDEQRFYNVFSPMISCYTICEQQKGRGFTMFSAQ